VQPSINILTLTPSIDEMKDFNKFILSLNLLASEFGDVKIIPPKELTAHKSSEKCHLFIKSLSVTPTYQDINRIVEGIYIQTHERFKEPISVQQYCDLTAADGIERLNLNQREVFILAWCL